MNSLKYYIDKDDELYNAITDCESKIYETRQLLVDLEKDLVKHQEARKKNKKAFYSIANEVVPPRFNPKK